VSRPRVLAVVGPTGTGKSDLALEVARRTGAEIISADSMQVYRGMDIGTAKVPAEVRAELPHHGIDIADPDEPMSAGRFALHARAAAHAAAARGRPVVLCGGTGLYARAFAGGLIQGVEADPELRARLEALATPQLLERLRARDPAAAERIPASNRVRVLRALEICELGGAPVTRIQAGHGFSDRPFDVRWLALDLERGVLWERLARRVDAMFDKGLVDEVARLHRAGYGPQLRPLRAIGYREVGQLLRGELDEPSARQRIAVATRQLARRQRTWFRAEPRLEWADAARPARALERALTLLGA
jgi:tRNA dimethylallyltransferase